MPNGDLRRHSAREIPLSVSSIIRIERRLVGNRKSDQLRTLSNHLVFPLAYHLEAKTSKIFNSRVPPIKRRRHRYRELCHVLISPLRAQSISKSQPLIEVSWPGDTAKASGRCTESSTRRQPLHVYYSHPLLSWFILCWFIYLLPPQRFQYGFERSEESGLQPDIV